MSSVRPIFIFSLPRSGSTLLQRAVATHPDVSTVSEPWLLLPPIYYLRGRGVFAEYGHQATYVASTDLINQLPGGEDEYLQKMGQGVRAVYAGLTEPGASHFLDKTPRYHMICDEIMRMFPDAACIFLWRNPLSIAASMANTWGGGHWNLFRFTIDLEHGLQNMVSTAEKHADRAHHIRFEDFVEAPEQCLAEMFTYIGLAPDSTNATTFRDTKLDGQLGDKSGTEAYSDISTDPVNKWKDSICNNHRRRWCRRYLKRTGAARLSAMGYSIEQLEQELADIKPGYRHLVADYCTAIYGFVDQAFRRFIFSSRRG